MPQDMTIENIADPAVIVSYRNAVARLMLERPELTAFQIQHDYHAVSFYGGGRLLFVDVAESERFWRERQN